MDIRFFAYHKNELNRNNEHDNKQAKCKTTKSYDYNWWNKPFSKYKIIEKGHAFSLYYLHFKFSKVFWMPRMKNIYQKNKYNQQNNPNDSAYHNLGDFEWEKLDIDH